MRVVCETENLLLREFLDLDSYELYKMNSDHQLMSSVNEKPYLSENDAIYFIEKMKNHYEEYGFGLWAIHEKKSGRFVGWGGFRKTKHGQVINIRLNKKFHNKGFGTEIIDTIIDYGKNDLKLEKIVAKVKSSQVAALKILQKSKLQQSIESELIFNL